MDEVQQFLSKCRPKKHCWVWIKARRGKYGVIRTEHGIRNAHRVAYALMVGPVDLGQSVVHTCGNKLCCNPRHLKLVVQEKPMTPGAAKAYASV